MKKLLILLFFITLNVSAEWISGNQWSFWGPRDYKLYIPEHRDNVHPTKLPVILALHGCMQNPESFAGGSRLNQWADKMGFAVLYPEQSKYFNPYNCWNWFLPMNQAQSSGESGIIMAMLDSTAKKYNLDLNRVFLLGISAGAATANILANCYPNSFKAFASHHGVMYKGATDAFTAKDVVYDGSKESPERMAKKGYSCSRLKGKNKLLPAIIIHGSKGAVMKSIHAVQVEEELKAFNDYLDNGKRDFSINNGKFETTVPETDRYGYNLIEWKHEGHTYIKRYMIQNLGHAWSGGDNQWEFNDQHGPDATAFILNFFNDFGLQSKK